MKGKSVGSDLIIEFFTSTLVPEYIQYTCVYVKSKNIYWIIGSNMIIIGSMSEQANKQHTNVAQLDLIGLGLMPILACCNVQISLLTDYS